MKIERYTELGELKVARPELARVTYEQILESTLELSKRGVASSGGMTEGYFKYEGEKREWVQQFLYEDHPHESRIRYEFRYDWGHEYGRPMAKDVSEVLRDKLMQIPNAAEVLTMFGHYGAESSSIFVLVWITRTITATFKGITPEGQTLLYEKEMTFEELWGFDPDTGRTV
jgi:hypothetical protein